MSEVTCIGKCIGCDRMRKVKVGASPRGGICTECLESPARGASWAERAHRCRTEPAYARMVYESIDKPRAKKLFIGMFGLPEGAAPPVPEAPVPTGTLR